MIELKNFMWKGTRERKWEAARRKATRSLAQISDSEDAALTRAAMADPDNPTIDERMCTDATGSRSRSRNRAPRPRPILSAAHYPQPLIFAEYLDAKFTRLS